MYRTLHLVWNISQSKGIICMVCLFQTSIVFSLSVVADPTKPTQSHHSQDRMPVDCGLIFRFATRYVSSLTDSHTDTVYRRSTCIEYLWIYSAQMCGHMVPCGMNTPYICTNSLYRDNRAFDEDTKCIYNTYGCLCV